MNASSARENGSTASTGLECSRHIRREILIEVPREQLVPSGFEALAFS